MRLSTSTNLCAFTAGRERLPVEFCMETLARAGYRVLDMNFCIAMNPDSPMRGEGWQDYVSSLKTLADSLGVTFSQAHLPYYDVGRLPGDETDPLMEELIRRSIRGCAMLDIPWAVTHPITRRDLGNDRAAQLAANRRYFMPHAALAASLGVGIALENDYQCTGEIPTVGADIGELCALTDSFGDPAHVGCCYDFGHANLTDGKHRENLHTLGSRLHAVHVQDNHGTSDEHLLPFFGSIDWQDAMSGLTDIGYPGDLTFEVQEFGRCLPRDMKHLTAELSLQVGQRLLEMAGKHD